mmetsp:Transcript_43932/g.99344  ORF Transcript_43932/g.99344 Transcript_43932/m.99344 type:complete len:126 (-) Transcript_43932:394-771(-)
MAANMPPPKKFADLAEAKSALLKVITILEANEASIKQLITAAGDDQQKKMMTVVPALQALLGPVLVEFGFPPPPMGMMASMMSFTELSQGEGGDVLKEGMESLKAGMMGNFPTSEEIAAVKAKLS